MYAWNRNVCIAVKKKSERNMQLLHKNLQCHRIPSYTIYSKGSDNIVYNILQSRSAQSQEGARKVSLPQSVLLSIIYYLSSFRVIAYALICLPLPHSASWIPFHLEVSFQLYLCHKSVQDSPRNAIKLSLYS